MTIIEEGWRAAACDGYIDHSDFHIPDRCQKILESCPSRRSGSDWRSFEVSAAWKQSRCSLSEADERSLFLSMNCLKFLAVRRRAQAESSSGEEARRVAGQATSSLERSAWEVREQILTANVVLVRSIAARLTLDRGLREELVGVGNLILLHVVDRFDVRFGFRFSTYAGKAIRREMLRTIRRKQEYERRVLTYPELDPESPSEELDAFDREQLGLVSEILESMPDREREILKQRFGFQDEGETLSYRKLGLQFGVSPERVRQLVERSFDRVRDEFGSRLGLPS